MTDRLQVLEDLLARLRAPDGCPWDREQRLADLRAYLLEEAHEVAAAIDSGDPEEIGGELGDLLFQVVFVGQLVAEGGGPDLASVIEQTRLKMTARHPHVFGEQKLEDAAAVRAFWEKAKANERDELLGGVQTSLPSLVAAYRLTQKAAGVGFDWRRAADVLGKLDEEINELRCEISATGSDRSAALREEIGDLLFTTANLARKLGIDPEAALAGTNAKFRRRFAFIEKTLAAEGRELGSATLEELEELWQAAKLRRRPER